MQRVLSSPVTDQQPAPAAKPGRFDFASMPPRQRTLIMACILFWSVISYGFISRFVLRAGEVVGESMEPTLLPGERFLMSLWTPHVLGLHRGDIVALRFPDGPDLAVKRIVALPGESVRIADHRLYVDGRPLDEPYLRWSLQTDPGGLVNRTFRVEPDCYFVLGDNREHSADSRDFGAIRKDCIVGTICLCTPLIR